MAIAEELQIIVDAKVTQAVRDLKKVDKTIDNTSKTTGKLTNIFKSLAGPVAIGAVVAGVISIGKESEKAFQVQEDAIAGVNAALKATGQLTDNASQDIQDYAAELQGLTVIGDEATLSMIQTALNMGLTADQAKEAAKQAIGMSEAFGVGLETSLRAVANSTLGNYDALTRYLPAIKTANSEAEKAAIVQEQLANAFEVAKANAETAAGVQKQLDNAYGDLQETIGSVIAEAMTPYRKELAQEVVSVNESITAHILRGKALRGEATLVEELTLAQLELKKKGQELAQAEENIATAQEHVFSTTALNEQQIIAYTAAKQQAIEKAKLLVLQIQDEIRFKELDIRKLEEQVEVEKSALEANILLAQSIGTITEATNTNTLATDENSEATFINLGYQKALADNYTFASRAGTELTEVQKEQIKEVENYKKALDNAKVSALQLAEVGLGSLTSGFQDIGKAIVAGELQFKDFGKLAINVLADVLSSLGAQLAAISAIRFLAFDPAGGAGALAASAAAFTASGVAKGISGALPEGGSFTTNGPQTLLVGDNPGGNERVTVEPVSSVGANVQQGISGNESIVLMIDGEEFTAYIQRRIDNRNLRSSAGGVI